MIVSTRAASDQVTPTRKRKKQQIAGGRLNSPELMKVLLTVDEVAHKLSVGKTAIYRLMRRGELRYITVGRVRRVPVEAVAEYVAHASRYPAT
jgi:excisionase family DNA binding protein